MPQLENVIDAVVNRVAVRTIWPAPQTSALIRWPKKGTPNAPVLALIFNVFLRC